MDPKTAALQKLRRELEVTSYWPGKDRLFDLVDEAISAIPAPQAQPLTDAEIFAIFESVEKSGMGSYILGVARAIEQEALRRSGIGKE